MLSFNSAKIANKTFTDAIFAFKTILSAFSDVFLSLPELPSENYR